ncbi:MAG: AAA family ATPase [Deltaproteobacteria bacterium]|nr:AAA family ATPase [Deltaproteobacteria bacterium]
MRVARIEVFGFKSFMERLVLPLDSGITGVVGPNGCGKSNIVDAIRWVLGETKASSLRGELLEDVIFNGTENLRPLGLAEVTLTLRSHGKDFFADLTSPSLDADSASQSILEELHASSQLVTELNKQSEEERLREQGNQASEESEGQAEHSDSEDRPRLKVIQGNLGKREEEITSSSLTQDESSEHTPESKPDKKQRVNRQIPVTFLSRFAWLKSTSEVQVTRRLYRSGESEFFINRVPCRLKDIKDLFRAVGLSARAYTVVAQGEVSRIVTSKPEERRLILEDAAGVSGFRDKIAAANRRLDDTAINVSRLDDIIGEVSRQVAVLKRQAARARDRQALKDEISKFDHSLFKDTFIGLRDKLTALEDEKAENDREEAGCESRLERIRALEQEARSTLLTVDVATDDVRSKIDSIREELSNRARMRSAGESRVKELRALAQSTENERIRLNQRLELLTLRREEVSGERARISNEEQSMSAKLELLDKSDHDEALRSVASELEQERTLLKEKEKQLRQLRDQVVSQKSAIEQIKIQIAALSPLTQLQQAIFSEGVMQVAGGQDLISLSDCIQVEKSYVRALQAVLGQRTEYLVCEEPHSLGARFVRHRAEVMAESKTPPSLGALRREAAPVLESADVDAPGTLLAKVVKPAPSYEGVVKSILHGVSVVDSPELASKYFATFPNSSHLFVTVEGDLIARDSFVSFPSEGGVLQLRAKLEEFESECARTQDRHDHLEQECRVAEELIVSLEKRQSQLLQESQQREREVLEIKSQLSVLRGRLEAEERMLQQVQEDMRRLQSEIAESGSRLESFRQEEIRVLEELQSLVPDSEVRVKEELENLKAEHLKLDSTRREGHEKLSTLANELEAARDALDKARARSSHTTLEQQRARLEEDSLRERVIGDYGEQLWSAISAAAAGDRLSDEQREEFQREAVRLKNRLAREGEVDPTSIERFEEESARLEHLTEQRNDLHAAAATLKRTVEVLTETSEQRFLATFEAVRRNFSQLVPRLFGGGKADLELSDPQKPLESGIEIAVRPPGKKLRSIELLSGGEKALCATSLIFAMFMVRPSPLCVLDEVDAPLDDANLVRLLSLVREMAKQTQFVIITHNKQSMSVADNLIGVTMQEPGASKVISVSLQEAFSQVA